MVREKDLEVYGNLYKITQEYHQKAIGKELPFCKKAFVVFSEQEPMRVDILSLLPLDKPTFVQALYMELLYRPPERAAIERWKQEEKRDLRNYQEAVVLGLAASREAQIKRTVFLNNFYSNGQSHDQVIIAHQSPDSMVNHPAVKLMLRMYKCMPIPIRNIIRKLWA